MEKPIEEEIYEIENIAENEGCIVSLIKYLTLFAFGFILLWMITLKIFGALGFEYGSLTSFLILIILTGYLLHRIFNHSDEVYKIIFNDREQELTLISGNTFDGAIKKLNIRYDSLFITVEKKPLFNSKFRLNKNTQLRGDKLSQNRIVKIFNSNNFVSAINIELSSWSRHEKIDTVLDKLIKISNKK